MVFFFPFVVKQIHYHIVRIIYGNAGHSSLEERFFFFSLVAGRYIWYDQKLNGVNPKVV